MNNIYKIIEVVGVSDESYEMAIKSAIERASQTVKAISWFEVVQQRGSVQNGKVSEFQVVLKLGFKLVE